MAMQRLRIANFQGGISDDEKYGPANSFSAGPGMDFRSSPGLMRTTRKNTKESAGIITTEVTDMARVDVNNGDVYMAGHNKIYKRTPGANGAAGSYTDITPGTDIIDVQDLDYRADLDSLLLIDAVDIHEYRPLSTTPTFQTDKYREYISVSQSNSGGAYVLPAAIDETKSFDFIPTKEPVYSITFHCVTKGTGDWTVSLHDGEDRLIASKQVLAAGVVAGNDVEFIFASPVRVKLNVGYHYHIVSSNGTGTIESSSANTLPLATTSIKASRLVDTGVFGHHAIQYGAKSYICNERYLTEWEILDTSDNATAGYDAHRLVFPSECIALNSDIYNEYLAIGCAIKRSTDSTDSTPAEGIIFFWDFTSVFFQFALKIPQGAPNSLFVQDNVVYWEAKGRWYRWAGGDIEMIYEFPGVDNFLPTTDGPNIDLYLRAGRKCATNKDSLILLGFPYASANQNTKIGVFSFGNTKGFMPKALGYEHTLSTGHTTPQFDTSTTPDTPITGITCMKRFGSNLLIAWRDVVTGAVTYGVDYVNDTSGSIAASSWESLWFDNGDPDKEKSGFSVKVTCKALPAGCTITPKYRYDRSDTWIYGSAAVAGATSARMTVETSIARFHEAMWGFDIASASGNFAEPLAISFKFDDNEEEEYDT